MPIRSVLGAVVSRTCEILLLPIVVGIIVGVVVAIIIQDARFAPDRQKNDTPTATPRYVPVHEGSGSIKIQQGEMLILAGKDAVAIIKFDFGVDWTTFQWRHYERDTSTETEGEGILYERYARTPIATDEYVLQDLGSELSITIKDFEVTWSASGPTSGWIYYRSLGIGIEDDGTFDTFDLSHVRLLGAANPTMVPFTAAPSPILATTRPLTDTPRPSATPSVSIPLQVRYVKVSGANIRGCISTDCEILGTLGYGESFLAIDSKNDLNGRAWYCLEFEQHLGWIAGWLTDVTPPAPRPTETPMAQVPTTDFSSEGQGPAQALPNSSSGEQGPAQALPNSSSGGASTQPQPTSIPPVVPTIASTGGPLDIGTWCGNVRGADGNAYVIDGVWYCKDGGGNLFLADLNAVCAWQYPGTHAWNPTQNNDPGSWVCIP